MILRHRARQWQHFCFGLGAGLILAEILAMSLSYSTPALDLLQALDFLLY